VFLTNSNTLINAGTIAGGNGGAGGAAGTSADSTPGMSGMPGAGGVGVIGTGSDVIVNSGTISGGLDPNGTRADAIDLTGGHNTLELRAGFKIIGNAVSKGPEIPAPNPHFEPGGDTLALGGTEDSSFNVALIGNIGQVKAQYQGFGSLVKTGTSTWELTAFVPPGQVEHLPLVTYDIPVTVQEGILAVGPTTGSVEGVSDALGSGDVSVLGGTLRTTSFQNSQPLAINVGRNYTQGPKGILALGIGGPQLEQYDRVVTGGNATLDATLVVTSLGGFRPSDGSAFLVLRTGGKLRGRFDLLNDSGFNTNPNLTHQLRLVPVELVAPNGILLVYVEEKTPPGPGPQPPIIEPVPDPVPPVDPEAPISDSEVVKLLNFSAQQLTSLYEISFSEANIQRFNLDDRMTQIQRSLVTPPPAPVAPAPPSGKEEVGKAPPTPPVPSAPRWGVWANGWGDWAHIDSTSTALGYHFTTGGMSAGIDYLITDHLAVGLFGGYSHTWVDFKPGGADVDTGRGGLYATYFDPRGWWVNAGVWGGYNSYSTSRQALLGPANGSTDGYEISTFGEAGYNFHCGDLTWGPLVAMQYTDVHVFGFSEHGSLVPLDIHSNSQDSLRTDLGAQASYCWHLGKTVVIPGLKLAWEHEYRYSNLDISGSAPDLNNATATFNGPNLGHDSLIIEANVGVQITPQIAATIGYDGQLARDHYISNAVTGTFSFSF
jgi:outer membrane autotransporter protein